MASTIQGPIIKFSISSVDLAGPLRQAFSEIQGSARASTQSIASQWQTMAAKIRADIATEALGTKNVVAERQALTGILGKQISLLQNKNELTTKELSSLKAMTLEFERQADAQARGSKIGVTAGTSEALGRVGSISGMLGQFAGGGPLAGGLAAITGAAGMLSQAFEKLGGGGVAAEAGVVEATGGLAAFGVAAGSAVAVSAALAAGIAGTTIHMLDFAQSVKNTASVTGLSVEQVQQFSEVSKLLGVDADSVTNAIGRIQMQLGQFITKGSQAGATGQNFVRVAAQLGVPLKDANDALRPINDILGDFSIKLAAIQDPEERAAIGMEAFGTRGKALVEVMGNLGPAFDQYLANAKKAALSTEQIEGLAKDKEEWDQLVLKVDAATLHVQGFTAMIGLAFAKNPIVGWVSQSMAAINPLLAALGLLAAYKLQPLDAKAKAPALPSDMDVFRTAGARLKAQQDAAALVTAQTLQAGGPNELLLQQKQEALATAIQLKHGLDALILEKEVETLTRIVSLEHSRAAIKAQVQASVNAGDVGSHALESPAMKAQQLQALMDKQNALANNIDLTPSLAQTLPGVTASQSAAALASITATNSAITTAQLATFSTLKTSIEQDYTATFETATQKIQANLGQIENQLTQYALLDVSRAQEVANLKVEAEATAQAQILQLQDDAAKQSLDKAEQEAGQLFDALLTGSSKKISATFEKVFEEIATAPIKKLFEVSMAAMLKPLDDSLTNAVKPYVTSISNWILGKKASPNPFDLNNPNNPYATPGGALASIAAAAGQNGNVVNSGSDPNNLLILNLKRSLGLGGRGVGGSVPGGTAPVFQISDATMYVQTLSITASTVNLTSTGGIQHPQSPVPGSMDGDHAPVPDWATGFMGMGSSGANSFSAMNLMPSLGAAGAGLSLGPALSALPGLTTTLQNAMQQNSNAISNASAMQYGAVSSTGGPMGGSAGTPSSSAMAGWMQAAAGGLMVYEASQHGGVGGAITGAIGGAELGAKIGSLFGPEGTIAGLAIGAIGGLLTGVFGHKDRTGAFDAAVKTAGYNEQYHAPPPETFSFAEGSTFAQTMATTFSQAGTSFAKVALPNGTPFWMNAITGPLSTKVVNGQPSQAQLYNNLNNGLPFFGAPTYGLGPQTLMPPIQQTNLPPNTHQTSINFTLPPSLTQSSGALLGLLVQGMLPHLTQQLGRSFPVSSSGLARRSRAANNLP